MGLSLAEEEPCSRSSSRPHILIVTLSGFGHQFAKLLHFYVRNVDATVTVVSTQGRISEFVKVQAKGDFHGIDLRLIPAFSSPALYPDDPNFAFQAAVIAEQCEKEFKPFAKKLIHLKEKDLPGVPTCVMSDMFLCFAEELASELDVPWYSAYVTSLPHAVPKLYKEGLHRLESPSRNEVTNIGGSKFARVRDTSHENLEFAENWHDHSERMSSSGAAGIVLTIWTPLQEHSQLESEVTSGLKQLIGRVRRFSRAVRC